MTDYTKADFVLTAFATVAAMESAASALVALEGKVSGNISRAAWGLAIVTAIQQPELSAKAISADVALAMNLAAEKGGRHQPLVSRIRSSLAFVTRDGSPVALPKVTGADSEVTAIAKAERFIVKNALATVYAKASAIRTERATDRSATKQADEAKAEKAALSLAGVTAKVPFSLTAITEGDDFVGLMASARAGDADAIKIAEFIVRQVSAAIVAGENIRDARADKAKAKRPAKVALKAVA